MLVGVMFNVVANENMSQGKKVAVLPFAVKGNFDTLYAEVALDNFTTELIKSNTYKIVERPQLDKAMKDLKFQSGSAIDESVAMEIAKNTGAKIVVIGEITALMRQIVVNIRGINVDSSIIEFADKGIINSQDELLVAIERIAKKFFGSENFAAQNYVNQSPAMDFSINTEYTKYATKEFDKRFIDEAVQELYKDCISRQEAIRIAEQGQIQGYIWQFKKLCTLPPVEPERKIGKWHVEGFDAWCTNCGFHPTTIEAFNYCPNCGAKMEVN
jgi:TolB-like protein